jgi:DNA-directed RNA polymerase
MDYLKSLLPNDPSKPVISWTSPIGMDVNQHYAQADDSNTVTLEYSRMKIYLQKRGEGKTAKLHKHKQGISPNFVHSCDAAHMMKTVNAAKTAGIDSFLMVHDSYATHAADMDTLGKILREEFVEMYSKDNQEHPMKALRRALPPTETQKTGKKRKRKVEMPHGDFDINEVLKSEYFFS